MTLANQRGYAVIVTCLLLPAVLLSLGMIAFSLLKSRHSYEVKTTCQQNYHHYFSVLKNEIDFIEAFNPAAVTLHHIQLGLLPMIWLPPVLKLYRMILKLRQTLERVQNMAFKLFNSINIALSIKTFAGIQRTLFSENRKLTQTLTHQSLASYSVNPKLQLVKRMNILFPPYDPHPEILRRQRFQVSIRNKILPKSWMNTFAISRLFENYTCSASLQKTASQLAITYQL